MPSILDDFPRGVHTRDINQHNLPFAAWTDADAILASPALRYDPHNPGGKLLLGVLNNQLIGIEDDRHMITVAGSRSGKGVSMIIPNLLFYRGSMLVIDPKGELASITARRRAQGLKQQVFVLDPFERTADWVRPYKASFNPMAILTLENKNIVEDAGLIADALARETEFARLYGLPVPTSVDDPACVATLGLWLLPLVGIAVSIFLIYNIHVWGLPLVMVAIAMAGLQPFARSARIPASRASGSIRRSSSSATARWLLRPSPAIFTAFSTEE